MHTGKPGFKHREKRPDLKVDYIHMGALLGYVVDIVIGAVMAMDVIDTQTKTKVLKAFNKLIWIQNDLFARHYIVEAPAGEVTASLPGDAAKEGTRCPFSG